MLGKRIATYLDKIEAGEAIDYKKFLSLLPEDLREQVTNCTSTHFIKKGAEKITIADASLLQRLKVLAQVPVDRIEASLQGDSHKAKVSTSYLFVYHQGINGVNPDTVICNESTFYANFRSKSQLVIVENAELFFARDMLLELLNKVFKCSLSFANVDLVFGSGNQISNQYNQHFLAQYESVLCFFDYDLGGLKIFKAMKNLLGDKARLAEPVSNDLDRFFVKKPKNAQQFISALTAANELGLHQLHQIFEAKQLFMEQEALLALA
ncbi:hypothetical protein DXX93_00740 [Thalassotalea euphylliae]|uniref:Wadjet protein JetD C-terminal domain-containing protein n=1 Tax=Thalassotalea euphylliae TaxID=1655234 RepID=A0A3E0TLL0_9GAMM|nr:hypothetical protein [Thalassotalea euphylliae]REL25227.1 hypothetical protein DXX93_00740 [Thalassotalea euphylliae]